MTPNVRLGLVLVCLGLVIATYCFGALLHSRNHDLFPVPLPIPLDLGTHISASPRGTWDKVTVEAAIIVVLARGAETSMLSKGRI
jgi:hypothetical protein